MGPELLRPRIFVIEDQFAVRAVVREALATVAGYDVEETDRVAGAIEQIVRFQPDLVLTDLQLPDASGVDILVGLRSVLKTKIPVIAFTGQYGSVEEARRKVPGFTDFLIKPVGIDALLETVERWLPRRRGADAE